MASKSRSSAQQPPDEPVLSEPPESVEAKIHERIDKGLELLPSRHPINTVDDLKARRQKMYTWNEYNHTLLRRLLGPAATKEYRNSISFGGSSSPAGQVRELEDDLHYYIRQLDSIRERLPLWELDVQEVEGGVPPIRVQRGSDTGPIFIVHGRDLGRANEVARVLERATDRRVAILHEQPNRGRTLIEKFEEHAADASFAVVVLTADDEGRKKGDESLAPRGRQNVIFEMGFFFALLGRRRVVVLLDPSVEHPSDVSGLVYVEMDTAGAWRHTLAREVAAAGIRVDLASV